MTAGNPAGGFSLLVVDKNLSARHFSEDRYVSGLPFLIRFGRNVLLEIVWKKGKRGVSDFVVGK